MCWPGGRISMTGEDIVITEVDLDNLMRAKGAMYAGYQTLLESVGMGFADLDRVILAGNFGAYIDLERAITHRPAARYRPGALLLSGQCLAARLPDQSARPPPFPGTDGGAQADDQHGAVGKPRVHEPLHGGALSAPYRYESFPVGALKK